MKAHDEAVDRQMDWALAERLGGEAPPDLSAAIARRHRDGDGAHLAELAASLDRGPTRGWLVAALVLLGVGVVLTIALRRDQEARNAESLPPEVPAPQDPAPVAVQSVAELEAVPATTRRLVVNNCGDEMLPALLRLRELADLEVHVRDSEGYGMGLKIASSGRAPSITAAGLDAICRLSKLRRLVLSGTQGVLPTNPDAPGVLDGLQRLPLLAELTLRCFYVSDNTAADAFAVLPRLPVLTHLDLSFNHGFGERGIEHVLRCKGLEVLSLRGCQQLHGGVLARLGELPALRELDVSLLDGINWHTPPEGEIDSAILDMLRDARQAAGRAGAGVTDEALHGICQCKTLRHLELANSRFTAAGTAPLVDLRQLEGLGLFGNAVPDGVVDDLPPSLRSLRVCSDELTDDFCVRLRKRLPALTHLDVSACYGIHDAGVAALVAIPTLRTLDLRQMYGLTVASIPHLSRATQLTELDIRHCAFVTAAHVAELRRVLPGLQELQSNVGDGRSR